MKIRSNRVDIPAFVFVNKTVSDVVLSIPPPHCRRRPRSVVETLTSPLQQHRQRRQGWHWKDVVHVKLSLITSCLAIQHYQYSILLQAVVRPYSVTYGIGKVGPHRRQLFLTSDHILRAAPHGILSACTTYSNSKTHQNVTPPVPQVGRQAQDIATRFHVQNVALSRRLTSSATGVWFRGSGWQPFCRSLVCEPGSRVCVSVCPLLMCCCCCVYEKLTCDSAAKNDCFIIFCSL